MTKEKTFVESLIKRYSSSIIASDELPEGIPTGSVSLDASCGTVGGIPRGRFTEISGSEATGKTTLALSICKYAVELGKVLYCDTEFLLSPDRAREIIGNTQNLLIVQPATVEDTFDIADQAIRTGEFSLIVIDSLGAMPAVKQVVDAQEEGYGQANVALLSRLVTVFLQNTRDIVSKTNTAVLFLNQVRANIGTMSKGYTTPGGHALKHFNSLEVTLSKGAPITHEKQQVGAFVKFTVKKCKFSASGKAFDFPLMYKGGIDTLLDTLRIGKAVGVLSQRGSWYYYNDLNLGAGINEAKEKLKDKELFNAVRSDIIKTMSSVALTTQDDDV